MGCSPVTYRGVTSEVFNCLKKELEDAGFHVPSGNIGEISGDGVTADFNWDEGAANLTITIKKKPLIASCGYVSGKIHDYVKKCGGD